MTQGLNSVPPTRAFGLRLNEEVVSSQFLTGIIHAAPMKRPPLAEKAL